MDGWRQWRRLFVLSGAARTQDLSHGPRDCTRTQYASAAAGGRGRPTQLSSRCYARTTESQQDIHRLPFIQV
jgi:hypothetical protein